MATAIRPLRNERIADILETVEDGLLDDLASPFLGEEGRVAAQRAEVVLTAAVEDGTVTDLVLDSEVFDLLLDSGFAFHTDFVGGVECNDCRGTFFLRKNGTHCPSCKGLL